MPFGRLGWMTSRRSSPSARFPPLLSVRTGSASPLRRPFKSPSGPKTDRQPGLGQEKPDQRQVQLPQRRGHALQNGEEIVAVVEEIGGGFVGGRDGTLHLGNPGRGVIDADIADRRAVQIVPVDNRDLKVFNAVRGQDAATVAITLLLEMFAGLQSDLRRNYPVRRQGKISCRGRKPARRRTEGDRQQHSYSMGPFSRSSLARTMPRLELRMKFRIVSRSSD